MSYHNQRAPSPQIPRPWRTPTPSPSPGPPKRGWVDTAPIHEAYSGGTLSNFTTLFTSSGASPGRPPDPTGLSRGSGAPQRRMDLSEMHMSLSILHLDPADRAVLKVADERDAVQKKTFTNWMNKHLAKTNYRIRDLFQDLRTGHALIALLEALTGQTLPKERGNTPFHHMNNVQNALKFLSNQGIRLVNIRPDEIVDGNPKLTLGLIWVIIMRYQISDVIQSGTIADDVSVRQALLQWSRSAIDGYPGIQVRDFSSSWRDGKAFLALMHRFRPDLVDLSKAERQTAEENLEMAFRIAEKELGVTRLLDPEDVSVVEPDERSLITYVSSLYDVFPPGTPGAPGTATSAGTGITSTAALQLQERRAKWEEYRRTASEMSQWLREATTRMLAHNFPTGLQEMRQQMAGELNRHKREELPARDRQRRQLAKLYEEIKDIIASGSSGQYYLEPDLRLDQVERLWEKYQIALQEKELAVGSELKRLERLHLSGDKLYRDCKTVEARLEGLWKKIKENEENLPRMHPMDAGREVERAEQRLSHEENQINGLFSEVQMLRDGRYIHSEDLYRRVCTLHQRYLELQRLHRNLSSASSLHLRKESGMDRGGSLPRLGSGAVAQLVEQNQTFSNIQRCREWVRNQTEALTIATYGSDLKSAQECIRRHDQSHREIDRFQTQIERCRHLRSSLRSEEKTAFDEMMQMLDEEYSALLVTSSKRSQLSAVLLDFLQSATEELMWINEKEEIEISRDWSVAKRLNVEEIQKYFQALMDELEKKEAVFNRIITMGTTLHLDTHPASQTIQAFVSAMESQWFWMLQLTHCLEVHLEHTVRYQQFFAEAMEADQFLTEQTDRLNSYFLRPQGISVDEGEKLIREIRELYETIREYSHLVDRLIGMSQEVVPMRSRHPGTVTAPGTPGSSALTQASVELRAVCPFRPQLHPSIAGGMPTAGSSSSSFVMSPSTVASGGFKKDDVLSLIGNANPTKWKVRTRSGTELTAPSVCFVVSGTCEEAVQQAHQLSIKLQHLFDLWGTRELHLKEQLLRSTMRVVKGWSLEEFHLLNPEKRRVIIEVLNQDADRLLVAMKCAGVPRRDLDSFQAELASCNAWFAELTRQGLAPTTASIMMEGKGAQQNPQQLPLASPRQLSDQLANLTKTMEGRQAVLRQRLMSQVPRDLTGLEQVVAEHKEFETNLQSYEREVNRVAVGVRGGSAETAYLVPRCEELLRQWDSLWEAAHLFVIRLKAVELFLSRLDELDQVVCETELALAARGRLPASLEEMRRLLQEIKEARSSLRDLDNEVAQLDDSLSALIKAVMDSRSACGGLVPSGESAPSASPGAKEVDLARLEQTLRALQNRWGRASRQIDERLTTLSQCVDLYSEYKSQFKPLATWLVGIQTRVKSQSSLHPGANIQEHRALFDKAHELLKEMARARPDMDVLNRIGAKMITIGRRYDEATEQFREDMEAVHAGSLTSAGDKSKRARVQAGVETVMSELSRLNKEFDELAVLLRDKLTVVQQVLSGAGVTVDRLPDNLPKVETFQTHLLDMHRSRSFDPVAAISPASVSADLRASVTGVVEGEAEVRNKSVQVVTSPSRRTVPIHPANAWYVTALLHPGPGRKQVTLAEAIQQGLLDLRKKRMRDPKSGTFISLSDALRLGYLSQQALDYLYSPCGLRQPVTGKDFTLADAILSGYLDLATCRIDPSRVSQTAEPALTLQNALRLGRINKETYNILASFTSTGVSTSNLTTYEAHYAIPGANVGLKLTVSDTVEHGLYNPRTGRFFDPVTHKEMTYAEGVQRGLFNLSTREVSHPTTASMLPLQVAISEGIIDAERGQYRDGSHTAIGLDQARQEKKLSKPRTLHELVVDGAITADGCMVVSARPGGRLTLIEAIGRGMLDSDAKCIIDNRTGEALTLNEATQRGIITAEGKFVERSTGRHIPIQDAVNENYVTLVKQEVTVCLMGILDPTTGANYCISDAIKHGLLDPTSGEYIDPRSKRSLALKDAGRDGLIEPQMLEALLGPSGLKETTGRELSVIQAIQKGRLDTDYGRVSDPYSSAAYTIQEATSCGILAPEKAELLMRLTCPLLCSTVMTNRIVLEGVGLEDATNQTQGSDQRLQQSPVYTETMRTVIVDVVDPISGRRLGIDEAVRRKIIDMENGLYHNSVTKETLQLSDAIRRGLVTAEPHSRTFTDIHAVSVKETKAFTITGVVNPSTKAIIDPIKAVEMGIIDQTAHFYNGLDASGKPIRIPFTEAIAQRLIIADSRIETVQKQESKVTSVLDTRTGLRVPVQEATRANLINPHTGIYCNPLTKEEVPLKDAIERGLVFVDEEGIPPADSLSRQTPIPRLSLPDVPVLRTSAAETRATPTIEVSGSRQSASNVVTLNELISSGHVDPITGMIRLPSSRRGITIGQAIADGRLDAGRSVVKDPATGRHVPLETALQTGLLDPQTGAIKNYVTGEVLNMQAAIQEGLFPEEVPSMRGVMTFEEALERGLIDVQSNVFTNVEDGTTMPIKEAIDMGILDPPQSFISIQKLESKHTRSERVVRRSGALDIVDTQSSDASDLTFVSIDDDQQSGRTLKYIVRSVVDTSTNADVPVCEAIRQKLIDLQNGIYDDRMRNTKISLSKAIEMGLVHVDSVPQSSSNVTSVSEMDDEARQTGYSSYFNVVGFIDKRSLREIGLDEAVERGILNESMRTLRFPSSNREMTLGEAISEGAIRVTTAPLDTETDGLAVSRPERSNTFAGQPSSSRSGPGGSLSHQSSTMPAGGLKDAGDALNQKGKPNRSTSSSGTINLPAQRNCIIYAFYYLNHGVRMEVPITEQMVREGKVDTRTAVVVDPVSGQKIRLIQAMEKGSVFATVITLTGEGKMYLEMFNKRHENYEVASVYNPYVNKLVPVREALSTGIIDPIHGTYKHPVTMEISSISDALHQGLIQAIPNLRPLPLDRPFDYIHVRTIEEDMSFCLPDPPPDSVFKQELPQLAKEGKVTGSPSSAMRKMQVPKLEAQVPMISSTAPMVESQLEQNAVPVAYQVKPGFQMTANGDVVDTENKQVISLDRALALGLVSKADPADKKGQSFIIWKIYSNQELDAAKYATEVLTSLDKELHWIFGVEDRLINAETLGLDDAKNRALLDEHQDIHNEILTRQQAIFSLCYQAEQALEKHGDSLSKELRSLLQSKSPETKRRLDLIKKETDSRLRLLTSSLDALEHFHYRLQDARAWQEGVETTLQTQQAAPQLRIGDLHAEINRLKATEGELCAHQGDLKALGASAQKFLNGAAHYEACQAAFCQAIGSAAVKPLDQDKQQQETAATGAQLDQQVREAVRVAIDRQVELTDRCRDRLALVNEAAEQRQRLVGELDRVATVLNKAESGLVRVRTGQAGANRGQVQALLDSLHGIAAEMAAVESALQSLRESSPDLNRCLTSCSVTPEDVIQISDGPLQAATTRHSRLMAEVQELCGSLQRGLVDSQDMTANLEGLTGWLSEMETRLDGLGPLSLNQDTLAEQERQAKMLDAEMQGRRPGLEAAEHRAGGPGEAEQVLLLKSRFESALQRLTERLTKISDLHDRLVRFGRASRQCSDWTTRTIDSLASRVFTRLDDDKFREKLREVKNQRTVHGKELEEAKRLAAQLLAEPKLADQVSLADALAGLDRAVRSLDELIEAREKELATREMHGKKYVDSKKEGLEWLGMLEARLNNLPPVAVDLHEIDRQLDELSPLIDQWEAFQPRMDQITELGHIYDAVLQGLPLPTSDGSSVPSDVTSPRSGSPVRRTRSRRMPYFSCSTPTSSLRRSGAGPHSYLTPLSPLSSSESSGVSSADNTLGLQDLTEVLQELEDMNDRYSLIGGRLADRKSDLETMLSRVRSFLDNMSGLMIWLDDKVTASLPHETLPSGLDEAKGKLGQHRRFHEELINMGPALESLRDKAGDLLRNREYVPGGAEVKEQLGQLEKKWSALKEMSSARQKSLEELCGQLDEFGTTQKNLTTWLGQKERMISVLGPLVTAPSLASTQLQQVRVLQDDLTSLLPDADKLDKTGKSLLEKLTTESAADTSGIRSALTNTRAHLTRLQGALREREAALGSVIGPSGEFYRAINQINDALLPLQDRVDAAGGLEGDNLRSELSDVRSELTANRAKLSQATELCRQLCQSTTDPAMQFELKTKVSNLERGMRDVQQRLDSLQGEMSRAEQLENRLEGRVAALDSWVREKQDCLLEQPQSPLSPGSSEDRVRERVRANQSLESELRLHRAELEDLKREAGPLLSAPGPLSPRAQRVKDRLDQLPGEIARLERLVASKCKDLRQATERASEFQDRVNRLETWMGLEEEKLGMSSSLPVRRGEVSKTLADIHHGLREIETKRGELTDLKTAAENLGVGLIGGDGTDGAAVPMDLMRCRHQLDEIQEKMDSLTSAANRRVGHLGRLQNLSQDLHDGLHDANLTIGRLEERLEVLRRAHLESIGGDPSKLLERTRALQEDADSLRPQVGELGRTLGEIIEELVAAGDTQPSRTAEPLREEIAKTDSRLTKLATGIQLHLDQLRTGDEIVDKFKNRIRILSQRQTTIDSQLNSMPNTALDMDSLRDQIDDVRHIVNQIDECKDSVDSFRTETDNLIGQGYTTAAGRLKDRVDKLAEQNARGQKKATDQLALLEKRLTDVEKFNRQLDDFMQGLDLARNDKVVASDQQKAPPSPTIVDQLKRFQQHTVAPLQKRLADLNQSGQQLLRTVAPGIGSNKVEHDLEQASKELTDLIGMVSQREQAVDTSLLKSGKLEDSMRLQHEFLTQMEENLEAAKGPPSAEYHIARAQLNAHKLLVSMLRDRQPSLEALNHLAEEVSPRLAGEQRRQLQQDLAELNKTFSTQKQGAESRLANFETGVQLAKQFRDQFEPALAWLDAAEKRLAGLDTSTSTDPNKIQQQINEHKAIVDDLFSRLPAIENLATTAADLSLEVSEPDREAVENKVTSLSDRLDHLQIRLQSRIEQLSATGDGFKGLLTESDQLVQWLVKADGEVGQMNLRFEDRLSDRGVVTQLRKMHDEILHHQKDLDKLKTIGDELVTKSKGADSASIRDRLDNVNSYYADLRNKSETKLRLLEQALPLAERFAAGHAKLDLLLPSLESSVRGQRLSAPEAEREVERLELELASLIPMMDSLKDDGGRLKSLLADGDMADRVEDLLDCDVNRFEQVAQEIGRRASRFGTSRARSKQSGEDLVTASDWLQNANHQITDTLATLPSDPAKLNDLRAAQHQFRSEWEEKKAELTDLVQESRRVVRDSPSRDHSSLQTAVDRVKRQMAEAENNLAEVESRTEQAVVLAQEFASTAAELTDWLADAEKRMFDANLASMETDELKRLQEDARILEHESDDRKPLIDKLHKLGSPLAQLVNRVDAGLIRDTIRDSDKRFNNVRKFARSRLFDLEEIIQQASEFCDQLESMADSLASTGDSLRQLEPIAVHPDRLQDQLTDIRVLAEDLDQRLPLLEALRKSAEEMAAHAAQGTAEDGNQEEATSVLTRANALIDQWHELKSAADERQARLRAALEASQNFWRPLTELQSTLLNLKTSLGEAGSPATDPAQILKQLEMMAKVESDIEAARGQVDACRTGADMLMAASDPPDHPEVKQAIEEIEIVLEDVAETCRQRRSQMEKQLEKAKMFQTESVRLLDWLKSRESDVDQMGAVGGDARTVMQQLEEVKALKSTLNPRHAEVEGLNQAGQDLTWNCSPEEQGQTAVDAALGEVNRRWDQLMDSVNQREHRLQTTLLSLGEFERALDALLTWIDKTGQSLDGIVVTPGDVRGLEVEMAKHKLINKDINRYQYNVAVLNRELGKMLFNDVSGHQVAVNQLESKANDLQLRGSNTEVAQRLDKMNKDWEALKVKSLDKQVQLDDALRQARQYRSKLDDLISRVGEVETRVLASKPMGGLPDSARDQLQKFMDLYNTFDELSAEIDRVQREGNALLPDTSETARARLEADLANLERKWEILQAHAEERKSKLEDALNSVEQFHSDLARFIAWLTQTEKTLAQTKPVSRIVSRVNQQVDAHSALKRDITGHREEVLKLDRAGTHVKCFSQKQDVVLIKNLLSSIHHRWERIVSRSAERTRHLDLGFKEAKKFLDMWTALTEWLREQTVQLDEDSSVGNDAEKIRGQIGRHKEFQRSLGAQHPSYDATRRFGKHLRDKAPQFDHSELDDMLQELMHLWQQLCTKSVERQRTLEEALLFSGQYKEALAALLDWLYKVEPSLADERTGYCGDTETVQTLLESHGRLEQEVERRSAVVEQVRRAARELMAKSDEDSSHMQEQLVDLASLWDRVNKLTKERAEKLDEAKRMAAEFGQACRSMMDYFAGVEHTLRQLGALPQDEEDASFEAMIADHAAFHTDLTAQRPRLDACLQLGHEILTRAHPEGVQPVKQWVTILKSRWDELSSWSEQRGQKLQEALVSLRSRRQLLEELLNWLTGAEASLRAAEGVPLPTEEDELHKLIAELDEFEQEIGKRQPDHDEIVRYARKSAGNDQTDQGHGKSLLRKPKPDPRQSDQQQPGGGAAAPHFANPRVNQLHSRWRQVWLLTMARRGKLNDRSEYLREVERLKNFQFDDWRKRYMQWMNNNKTRVMDFFHRKDTDRDGKVTRLEFIDGILESSYARGKEKFQTSRLEMEAVADIFDRDQDGFIDYKEFLAALKPDSNQGRSLNESEVIQDEVKRQVNLCTCHNQYKICKVADNKYKFGDSQKLRLVRILRSSVMVRVGGGWITLDEFLVKNDPCRDDFTTESEYEYELCSKGRMNSELREKFTLAEGVAQSMAPFKAKSGVAAGGPGSVSSSSSAGQGRGSGSQSRSSVPQSPSTPRKSGLPIHRPTLPHCAAHPPATSHPANTNSRSALPKPPSRQISQADSRASNSRPESRAGSDPSDPFSPAPPPVATPASRIPKPSTSNN